MGCGEFIAVKLPVSNRYATDSPVGANDEGTANKSGEEKELGEKKELGSRLGVVSDSCAGVQGGRGRDRAGDVLVSALKKCW